MRGEGGRGMMMMMSKLSSPGFFVNSRGDGGAGPRHNDVPHHCPTQSSMITRGQDGTCLLVPTSSHSYGIVNGGWHENHTLPPLNLFPPCWGEIMPAVAILKGGSVQPTHHPHSSSFTPVVGFFIFFCSSLLTEVSVNPKCYPLLLSLSPFIFSVEREYLI